MEVLDTENMEHGRPSLGKRHDHHHEDQSAVTSAAGNHHHHEDQSIAGKHREFIAENGCPNGGGKAMASLNREATMHALWQLTDA